MSDVVVIDLPRHVDDAAEEALAAATVTLLVVPAEVRAVAAAGRVAVAVGLTARDVRVVVRGPAPAGLNASVVADTLGAAARRLASGRARSRRDVRTRPAAGTLGQEPGCIAVPRPAHRPRGRPGPSRMTVDAALVERVRSRLVRSGDPPTAARVAAVLRSEGAVVGDRVLLDVVGTLRSELAGAGPLESLLADPDVTDVLVNGPAEVWVDRGDGLQRSPVGFADAASVARLAQRLAAAAGRRLDAAQPTVDARLPNGVRLHAVLPPISPAGPLISLRIGRSRAFTLDELQERATVTTEVAHLLREMVRRRVTFLVTGGTGSGKTTLLSSLLSEVAAAGAHRARRGLRRAAAHASPRRAARGPARQRRGHRTGRPARAGAPGAADATGPTGRRRGAGAPRSSTCSPRSTPVTTAAAAPCTPTPPRHCRRDSKRSRWPPGSVALHCTASSSRPCSWSCTSYAIVTARRRVAALSVLERHGDGLAEVVPALVVDEHRRLHEGSGAGRLAAILASPDGLA